MILRYFSVEQGLHVLGTFDIHVDCVSGRKKSLPDLHAEDPVLIDPKREVVLWVGGRIRGDIPLQIYIHPRCSGGIVDLIGTVFRKSHSCQRQAQRHSQNDADCSFICSPPNLRFAAMIRARILCPICAASVQRCKSGSVQRIGFLVFPLPAPNRYGRHLF